MVFSTPAAKPTTKLTAAAVKPTTKLTAIVPTQLTMGWQMHAAAV